MATTIPMPRPEPGPLVMNLPQCRPFDARGTWFLGVLSVIAGAVVLVWPWDSIVVLTLTTGVWLVLMGLVEIVWGLQMRNDSKTVREVENVVRERFGEIKQAS